MKMFEFNPDGSLKLPGKMGENHRKLEEKLKKAKENPRKCIISHEKNSSGEDWIIEFPNNMQNGYSILIRTKEWVYTQDYNFVYVESNITKENNSKFILRVTGDDKNSSRWAHSFLTALNTTLIKNFGTSIEQRSTCNHQYFIKVKKV